ncbi:hypothetical protein L9F63_010268 [Diploptera punctata]|uniref:Large ribosomal subunit protein bL34m n=1 Tax=Diploptera punctata TaxID=6984 RepID=A0AAD8AIH7_DIPPU|nr:hypothetical protein L9F63_010268 [Diploptera punctata]
MFTKRLGIQLSEFIRLRNLRGLVSNTRNLHIGRISPTTTNRPTQTICKNENTGLLQNVINKINLMQIKPISNLASAVHKSVYCQQIIGRPCMIGRGSLLKPSEISDFTTTVRTNVRCHLPRPSERKRIKKHGWKKLMSTPSGRKTIMRRILKGRHVVSH